METMRERGQDPSDKGPVPVLAWFLTRLLSSVYDCIIKGEERLLITQAVPMDNRRIAKHLLAYAEYLEAREANIYRVRAYRRAAETVLGLDRPVSDVVTLEGREGLEQL